MNGPQYTLILFFVCFATSLLWCGDVECLTGNEDDNCTALVCNLLGRHTSTEKSTHSTQECSCVCHTPTTFPNGNDLIFFESTQSIKHSVTLYIPSSPNQLVYRPPISA